jgi:hypothetical protein
MPHSIFVTWRLEQYFIPATLLVDHGCPEGRLGRDILFVPRSWWSVAPVLHCSGISDDKTTGIFDSASSIDFNVGTEFRGQAGLGSGNWDVRFGSRIGHRLSWLFSSVTPGKCHDSTSISSRPFIFKFCYTSYFTRRSIIRCFVMWILTAR